MKGNNSVQICMNISIHADILPGIGQMDMSSFLVTWQLSDRQKQFFLQQIVVSVVPWQVLTYPEKGVLAINFAGDINSIRNLIQKKAERKKTGHLESTKDKKNYS